MYHLNQLYFMSDFLKSKIELYALIVIFVVCSIWVLDIRSLVPPDEGRYAEMAREMFVTGDWITTRLNGIKYFEKPPLHMWMSAVAYALFGIGEWQARLWNGVCGIMGVLLVGYTGRKLFGGRVGFYAASILASMLFWTGASQFNTLDIGVAATLTISLCSLLIAQQDHVTASERRNWMLVCWAGLALSLLSKGLIGVVLPAAVMGLYWIVSGDRAVLRRLHFIQGCALFLAIAVPWFIVVAIKNPEQPHFFFINEHWNRFFLKEHHREGPWYYFLVLIIPATIPWLPLLPIGLIRAGKRIQAQFQPKLLLLIWIVFILFFFSYSKSKLPGYMLPVFPALALLAGIVLEGASRVILRLPAVCLLTWGIAGMVGLSMIGKLGLTSRDAALLHSSMPLLVIAFSVCIVAGSTGWYFAERNRGSVVVLVVAVAAWAFTQLSMAAYQPFGREQSGIDIAMAIKPEVTETTQVYSVGTYEQSMTFYLGHTVIPVAYTDELSFGLKQEPERGIANLEQFYERWRQGIARGLPQFAIIRVEFYEEMMMQGLPMQVRASNDRVVAVSGTNQPFFDFQFLEQ